MNDVVIISTGCPSMDALDLATAIKEGTATKGEAIAKLEHISQLIEEERESVEFPSRSPCMVEDALKHEGSTRKIASGLRLIKGGLTQ